MDRSEYLLSKKGRIIENLKRQFKIFYFKIEQEPRTKSITDSEAKYFRERLHQTLKEFKRRKFRSDIVLRITFFVSEEQNPPALQNLVKN